MASNTAIGKPPGLAAVFSISGGTAEIRSALATGVTRPAASPGCASIFSQAR
jgi:hypothetical protein